MKIRSFRLPPAWATLLVRLAVWQACMMVVFGWYAMSTGYHPTADLLLDFSFAAGFGLLLPAVTTILEAFKRRQAPGSRRDFHDWVLRLGRVRLHRRLYWPADVRWPFL
ncbi:hypothetical protein M0D69_30285 [Caballeronia sp. SEWSISQ10-4 2]|uniref:hypothetical protein n=1 Tax=Caballeronia sp. SEWSISQ10-4 2 TaxID=2937438 RepID=UPI00264BAE26|nr:hypothetical protein [Caballeronia sp. SEWSISQ10-4 2]MDN7182230.1 hypothetical protein [Caballeronia sp. SEWSISQ10-4 2]